MKPDSHAARLAIVVALCSSATAALADPALSPFIDTHVHLEKSVARESIDAAVGAMRDEGSSGYLFLPSPFATRGESAFDIELIKPLARKYPGKVWAMGGGGTLNPMLQQAAALDLRDERLEREFKRRALSIARQGAAGFGEFTSEHRPSASTPSFQSAPPDHRLLLLLADIAASNEMPIVLHMEAVPETMPLPESWLLPGVDAPATLKANIAGFERLLAHNPRARIVWAHGGWDNTGYRTPELCRRLLAAHPNLYMEIKIDPKRPGENSPLNGGASGSLKPEWLKLFEDYPDRFVLGSDQHYPLPGDAVERWQALTGFFNALPEELRRKFGVENVRRIYRLGRPNGTR
jgi:predicted TIM-barrel fold metal-dependent hydrolase